MVEEDGGGVKMKNSYRIRLRRTKKGGVKIKDCFNKKGCFEE